MEKELRNIKRRNSRVIKVGNVYIGGRNPITIQGMVKQKTSCIYAVLDEIKLLEKEGAELIRIAVKDKSDAEAIKEIKSNTKLPLIADIHFNWRLAEEAIKAGIDKVRLNPGNIYRKKDVERIIPLLKERKIPLRIGSNCGSLRRKYAHLNLIQGLVKQTLDFIKLIEKYKFYDLIISLKASSVYQTILAYKKIAKLCDYPLHLGITATGPGLTGIVKSSITLGSLLLEGIGDTIRVSLTDSSFQEVRVAKAILESLGLRRFGPEIISCPTCGRCSVDLVKMVNDLKERIFDTSLNSSKTLKIAVMGCEVNGPGEAKNADLGIAFGKSFGFLFKKNKLLRRVNIEDSIEELIKEIKEV